MLIALLLLSAGAYPAAGQEQHVEILSQGEAQRLFRMSLEDWEASIARAVAAGQAIARLENAGRIGRLTRTVTGDHVMTVLDYSGGGSAPASITVTMMYGPRQPTPTMSDTFAGRMLGYISSLMGPEFGVAGNVDRSAGSLAFTYRLTRRPAP